MRVFELLEYKYPFFVVCFTIFMMARLVLS